MSTHVLKICVCRLMMALAALLLVLPGLSMAQTSGKKVALLVGIGDYTSPEIPDLEGPPFDVVAMRDVLVARWGFRAEDVKSLVDKQATRANILAELEALGRRSGAGDEVLVYFSGHGTSALDAATAQRLAVPHGSGAFVPADFDPLASNPVGGLIVGRTDLLPRLSALEAGGRRLWVISDSCYSGQQVRSMLLTAGQLPSRMIPLLRGPDAQAQRADMGMLLQAQARRPEPYPYRATAYLAASSEGERAKDIPGSLLGAMPTIDGKPHGALTDALLRVLQGQLPADLDGDGLLSLNEVYRATSDFMAQRAYGHTPQRLPAVADDQQGLGNRPVLSSRGVAAPPRELPVRPMNVRIEGTAAWLAQAISGVPNVRLVGAGEPADLVLSVKEKLLGVISPSGDLLAGMAAADTQRAAAQVRQLAWAQRLRQMAEARRRGALATDVDPAEFGGNFVIGSKISFVVRPDRAANLVLLNIDSLGKVSVLYPFDPSETAPLAAGQARHIPGTGEQRIKVQEPVGMDLQFVFAFDQPPPGLSALHRLVDADPDDPRLAAFERSLAAMAGKFTFAATNLRTLKP